MADFGVDFRVDFVIDFRVHFRLILGLILGSILWLIIGSILAVVNHLYFEKFIPDSFQFVNKYNRRYNDKFTNQMELNNTGIYSHLMH